MWIGLAECPHIITVLRMPSETLIVFGCLATAHHSVFKSVAGRIQSSKELHNYVDCLWPLINKYLHFDKKLRNCFWAELGSYTGATRSKS